MRIRFNLSTLRPVRFLVAACVCALLVFSYAIPAYSAPINPTGSRTVPQEGEAQLRGIEREAQEAVGTKPYSRGETQAKANEGLNEIQGAADLDQMKRPENSQAASSVEDKLKNALESITGKEPTSSKSTYNASASVNPTGTRTAPQEGESKLLGIEEQAQKAVQADPYSREETQAKANPGLNEIQGTADIDKMNRPENSKGASSVEDKIKQALEGVKNTVTP